MKNYTESDYALNKFSDGIVYRFADGIVELTLESYLAENPDKTAEDFHTLKILSDAIYLEQVTDECRQTRRDTPLREQEDAADPNGVPLEDAYIDRLDKLAVAKAFEALLIDGKLTEIQERRFRLHVFDGFTFRAIAAQEGVYPNAIEQSIASAVRILKIYFKKF